MSNLLSSSKLFCKRNASTILTYIGGVGVVTTAVMTAKATPKALKRLEETKTEKGEELTKLEVILAAAPAYILAAISGAATLACIFGAHTLSKHQQASLMSAYALLNTSYKDYKNKVTELYGEEADQNVRDEIAKDKYEAQDIPVTKNKELFYDEFSERYFESTSEAVLAAEYELNRQLSLNYGVFLNEFYELLNIDTVNYGDYLGWSSCELVETYWYCWVEFAHRKVTMDDGKVCTIITMGMEPTFDFENY